MLRSGTPKLMSNLGWQIGDGEAFPIQPDAVNANGLGAANIVQQRIANMHGLFRSAARRPKRRLKDGRMGLAACKLAANKNGVKERFQPTCSDFGPLHGRSAVG